MDYQSSKIYSAFSRLISDKMAIMTALGIIIGLAGGFFGGVVHYLFPAVTASPGAYSIVGMGRLSPQPPMGH